MSPPIAPIAAKKLAAMALLVRPTREINKPEDVAPSQSDISDQINVCLVTVVRPSHCPENKAPLQPKG